VRQPKNSLRACLDFPFNVNRYYNSKPAGGADSYTIDATVTTSDGRTMVRRVRGQSPISPIAVGMSRLGTSEAVAVGAYAYAIHKLDQG
jgi:hypothetical protein